MRPPLIRFLDLPLREWTRLFFFGISIFLGAAAAAPALAQTTCPALPDARQAIERGWAAYRTNDIATAASEFKRALALCPSEPGALTGAGYAAMRGGSLPEARRAAEIEY